MKSMKTQTKLTTMNRDRLCRLSNDSAARVAVSESVTSTRRAFATC